MNETVFEKAKIHHEVKLHGCTFDRSDSKAINVKVDLYFICKEKRYKRK